MIAGTEAIAELHELHGPRRVDAMLSLNAKGIYISPLERAIVESHGYAFQANKEIEGIYA
ncbi:hypothetical protein [Actinacidiphila soli]|uniref:hypothetical protein n=1 Tax=Actinacidiphila soli TaxID=2487275 RepID=UPI000FC9B406|nr:hypothetical protein [Actinacidiphila soli]